MFLANMSAPSQKLPTADDIAMIVCDVDGTLLTEHHVVHPRTVSAFAQLRKLRPDLPIVIASGKQYSSCADVREALGLPDHFPAIHAHGALIHGDGGALLDAKRINTGVLLEVVDKMRGRGTFVFRPKVCGHRVIRFARADEGRRVLGRCLCQR